MKQWFDDFKTAVAFLTRLPMPHSDGAMPPNFVRAHRMFPVVGALIGAAVGLLCLGLRSIGVNGRGAQPHRLQRSGQAIAADLRVHEDARGVPVHRNRRQRLIGRGVAMPEPIATALPPSVAARACRPQTATESARGFCRR